MNSGKISISLIFLSLLMVACTSAISPTPRVVIIKETVIVNPTCEPALVITEALIQPIATFEPMSTNAQYYPTEVKKEDAVGTHDTTLAPRPSNVVRIGFAVGETYLDIQYEFDLSVISQDEILKEFDTEMPSYGWILDSAKPPWLSFRAGSSLPEKIDRAIITVEGNTVRINISSDSGGMIIQDWYKYIK